MWLNVCFGFGQQIDGKFGQQTWLVTVGVLGQDLVNAFPEAKKIFDEVDEICRKPISKLCFEGPMEELTLTVNLQPAIIAVNLACLTAINEGGIRSHIAAGHSLGEYAALASSESYPVTML